MKGHACLRIYNSMFSLITSLCPSRCWYSHPWGIYDQKDAVHRADTSRRLWWINRTGRMSVWGCFVILVRFNSFFYPAIVVAFPRSSIWRYIGRVARVLASSLRWLEDATARAFEVHYIKNLRWFLYQRDTFLHFQSVSLVISTFHPLCDRTWLV